MLLLHLSLGPGQALPLPRRPCSSGSLDEQTPTALCSPLLPLTSGRQPTGAPAWGQLAEKLRQYWVPRLCLGSRPTEGAEQLERAVPGPVLAPLFQEIGGASRQSPSVFSSHTSFRLADPCWPPCSRADRTPQCCSDSATLTDPEALGETWALSPGLLFFQALALNGNAGQLLGHHPISQG